MARKWSMNIILGVAAFLLTYSFSIVNNTWPDSLFRAGIGFVLFFGFGFFFRFFIQQISSKKDSEHDQKKTVAQKNPKIVQNEDGPMKEAPFQAISLTKLHDELGTQDPEKIAQTIHTWTKENQGG
ncbi:hypothetical protein [Neobacillus massiliamazoniensis]|uniref:Uncharacterized protein n=1 Tax=Neobacillus massiliamazoniensis TaxID=1499688 RepID=A0A0U1NS70_9BACI|nr:hypothetical protein [Neobacillus massiliamazoniensis]CRK80897.1 hypothetical protein BN000_00788 [Neobacillus massiliamazoniensis]